uniref:Argonaute n=1 Tax=Kwoniella bestiolae CBS 10118 TaxID=1296100 RepID=A0A1B9G505_9TREE|nr:hypothetical protein I302_03768 [Kwoniella bestiolae CBS 10118]OCF26091.1 hypothetical protein I302_03768 [Kwoniella bestiolae CBS 10118]
MADNSETKEIEDAFNSLSLRDGKDDLANCVPRPDFGRQGRKIMVSANMFKVTFKKNDLIVYHYDIVIESVVNKNAVLPKELKWKVWKKLCATAPGGPVKWGLAAGAYDRERNFFTVHRIPLSKPVVHLPVELEDEEGATERQRQSRNFRVYVRFAREIDLSVVLLYSQGQACDPAPRDMVAMGKAALNTLLRQDLYDRFVPKGGQGRRFFTSEDAKELPDAGLVLEGFIQSFVPTQSGFPAIQLDTAYGPFFKPGSLLGTVTEIFMGHGGGGGRGGRGGRGGGRGRGGFGNGFSNSSAHLANILSARHNQEKLTRLFYGAKYTLTHRTAGRPLQIEGFTSESAERFRFKINDGNGRQERMISAVEYYTATYNLVLKHPSLPMVRTGKEKDKKVFPMELVNLVPFNGIPFAAVSSNQTAEMIKVAAKPPPERKEQTMNWRRKLNYSQLPKLREWCLEVSPEMMKIPARILEPPQVQYRGRTITPRNGAWNLEDNKFAGANRPLKVWSVVCFDSWMKDPDISKLVGTLSKNGSIVENRNPPVVSSNLSELKQGLRNGAIEAIKKGGGSHPQLIVVILRSRESGLYQAIKRIAANELKAPVVTQIMISAKSNNARGIGAYLSNVAMKVHSKLGGVTHAVPVPGVIDQTTMLVGADVTHPPPTAKDKPLLPSIAVSVAAVNGDNNMFVPCVRFQTGRREMIEDLTEMMKDHIRLFEKKNGSKPQKILFFRDGVSEGQYDLCATIEMDRIKKAFKELDPKYNPKITLIICAKRHHMRFFAEDRRDTDKTGNLLPGTVVDSDVTHPYAFDFYLQAHAGLQGTARPTHYVVVVDENNFTADRMQGLCNSLCYSYARTSRAVSLVPVVYYADLIAWKARDFVYPAEDASDTASVVTGSSGSGTVHASFDPQQLYKRLEQVPAFNEMMWYM